MKKIVVLYHKDCPDGFGAAWVAWKKFGNKAEYIAIEPEELPPKKLRGKEIYVLDNSYPVPLQEKLRKENKKLIIIDHHASSEKNVRAFAENVFDNAHSGAMLAWRYFFPKEKIPIILRYIEDGDLWKFKLPSSKFITTYIYSFPFDYKIWNVLQKELETAIRKKKVIERGGLLLQYQKVLVQEVVGKAYLVRFEGYSVLAVNSASKILVSDIGHELYEKKPPMSIVWYETNGEIHVSLRSNGRVDVSKIAQKYGGGGHKATAGFGFPANKEFPWIPLENKRQIIR